MVDDTDYLCSVSSKFFRPLERDLRTEVFGHICDLVILSRDDDVVIHISL
jgi:hypothetical protein